MVTLDQVLSKLSPSLAKLVAAGHWGKDGCPYVFEVVSVGPPEVRRLRVQVPETGDVMGALGESNQACVQAMAARIGLAD